MQRSVQGIIRQLHSRSFASCISRQSTSLPRTIRQVIEAAAENGTLTSKANEVAVNGWIKSVRRQKNVAFAQLSDGTDLNGRGLQIVFEDSTLADR